MTTIAWDGATLAVDRKVSYSCVGEEACKLFKVDKNKYLAGAGCVEDIMTVVKYFQSKKKKKPPLEDFEGFLVDIKKGTCYYMRHTLIQTQCHRPTACGSGYRFALAAMACGKDAVGAIEIATIFDNNTGYGHDSITINKRK